MENEMFIKLFSDAYVRFRKRFRDIVRQFASQLSGQEGRGRKDRRTVVGREL